MRSTHSITVTKANSHFPYVAMLLSIALVARITVFIRRRDVAEFAAVDHTALLHLILIFLSCVVIVFLPLRYNLWKEVRTSSACMLLLYYLISGFSLIWSPLPEYSLFRSIEYLSQFVLICTAIWYCIDFNHAERRVLLLSMIAIIFGACVNLQFYGFSSSLLAWHTNAYSASAAMVFCYCFGEMFSSKRIRFQHLAIYGIVSLFFLLLGTSKSSYLSAVSGLIIAILLFKRSRMVIFLLIVIYFSYLSYGMIGSLNGNIDWISIGKKLKFFSSSQDAEITWHLHGRATLWKYYFEAIQQSPIYGYGFATFARLYKLPTTNTHNGYLAVLLGTGLIGFSFVLVFLLRLYTELRHSLQKRSLGSTGCTAALAAGLVNNMSISIVGEWWREPSLVFVAILSFHLFFVLRSESDTSKQKLDSISQLLRKRRVSSLSVPVNPTYYLGYKDYRRMIYDRRLGRD